MRTYVQLTQEQRYQIYALKNMGHTQSEMAQALDASVMNGFIRTFWRTNRRGVTCTPRLAKTNRVRQ